MESVAQGSFRVDGEGVVVGNILNEINSIVRIRNRSPELRDRSVNFEGTLTCRGSSPTFFSDVECGQQGYGVGEGGSLNCFSPEYR